MCTNPTFSHIHVLHARLHPPKGFESFGVLRRSHPRMLRLQAISRHLRPHEDGILRLSAAKVLIFKLVPLSSHLSPSACRRCDRLSPSVSRRWLLRSFTGCGPQACAPECSALTFGPEGELLGPRCLCWHRAPFVRACYSTPEPCRQVRRCFRGWDYPPGAFPTVQSPTNILWYTTFFFWNRWCPSKEF